MDIYEDLKKATPEELFEAAVGFYGTCTFSAKTITQAFLDGMQLGFKLGKGDWQQVAPVWLREWRARNRAYEER